MSSLLTSRAGFNSVLPPAGTHSSRVRLGTPTNSEHLVISIAGTFFRLQRSEQSPQLSPVWLQQTRAPRASVLSLQGHL